MRLQALPEADRVQLAADPEWAESFLGPEPELSHLDTRVWETYWRARKSNPHDAMGGPLPLDLVRAVDLFERVHGACSVRRLAEKLEAMDAAYLADAAEKAKHRREDKKGSR